MPTAQPTRSGRLLALVRKLIDYGRELAATLQKRTIADPTFARTCFGTVDLACILACIARGLHHANALEARVLRSAARLDAGSGLAKPRSAPRLGAAASAALDDHPRPVCLPGPAQIAAGLRHRPIGAIIGDICRDLGILPSHTLWSDVRRAMGEYRGNLARLPIDLVDRAFCPSPRTQPEMALGVLQPPTLQFAAPGDGGARPP